MCQGHGHEQAPGQHGDDGSAAASSQEPFPWDAGVFDAHCHPTTTPASIAAIPGMKARALAVMASRAQDQDLVAAAAEAQGHGDVEGGKVIPAFGYHPWSSHLIYDDTAPADQQTFDPKAAAAAAAAATAAGSGRETLDAELARHYGAVLKPSPADGGDAFFTSQMPAPEALSAVVAATRRRLARFPRAMLGEVGLDKAFRLPQPREPGPDGELDPPADDERDLAPGGRYGRRLSKYRVSMPHQERVLAAQLAVAAEMGRPVSVHGVQCQGVLLDALAATWKGHEREVLSRRQRALVAKGAEKYEVYDSDEDESDEHDSSGQTQIRSAAAKPPQAAADDDGDTPPTPKPYPPRICLHSFGGSVETMRQYLDPRIPARIYFSFSAALNLSTPTGGERVPDAIAGCPDDRILLETDMPEAGDEMDAALEHIYRAVCQIKGWRLREGVERIARNFEAFAYGP